MSTQVKTVTITEVRVGDFVIKHHDDRNVPYTLSYGSLVPTPMGADFLHELATAMLELRSATDES